MRSCQPSKVHGKLFLGVPETAVNLPPGLLGAEAVWGCAARARAAFPTPPAAGMLWIQPQGPGWDGGMVLGSRRRQAAQSHGQMGT